MRTPPRYSVDHDAPEALAALENMDGLVRFLDALQRVRDEVVDGQLAREVLVDEARDVRACGCTVGPVIRSVAKVAEERRRRPPWPVAR